MIVIGHRGAMGHSPENTIKSIRKALELGAKHIEIDVFLIESELVVFHDDRLERTTNGSGYLEEQSFSSLRELDAGEGEQIPTLSEVLLEIDGKAAINIELKGAGTASAVAQIISDTCAKSLAWKKDSFLVSSFNHFELAKFSKLVPSIKIGALHVARMLNEFEFAKLLNAYSVNPSLDFIDASYVEQAHELGFKVFCYTVNHPDDIRKMKKLGVDGIFTNYPERAIENKETYSTETSPKW